MCETHGPCVAQGFMHWQKHWNVYLMLETSEPNLFTNIIFKYFFETNKCDSHFVLIEQHTQSLI